MFIVVFDYISVRNVFFLEYEMGEMLNVVVVGLLFPALCMPTNQISSIDIIFVHCVYYANCVIMYDPHVVNIL